MIVDVIFGCQWCVSTSFWGRWVFESMNFESTIFPSVLKTSHHSLVPPWFASILGGNNATFIWSEFWWDYSRKLPKSLLFHFYFFLFFSILRKWMEEFKLKAHSVLHFPWNFLLVCSAIMCITIEMILLTTLPLY